MERYWTKVGAECMGLDLEAPPLVRRPLSRRRVTRAIKALKWQAIPCTLGAMPGLGINATIKDFRLKATHVAVTNELAPYGFYGIRATYKDGSGELYVLDTGTALIPLVSDFYRKAAA